MAHLPELQYCCVCREFLGPGNLDGICLGCEETIAHREDPVIMPIDGPRAQIQPMMAEEENMPFLTLTRKKDEAIVILTPQGNVVVRVLDLHSRYGGVKLDIDAPREVPISRPEATRKLSAPPHDAAESSGVFA